MASGQLTWASPPRPSTRRSNGLMQNLLDLEDLLSPLGARKATYTRWQLASIVCDARAWDLHEVQPRHSCIVEECEHDALGV